MILGVYIDSENYADLEVETGTQLNEVIDKIKTTLEDYDPIITETEQKTCIEFLNEEDSSDFLVANIFQISDDVKYLVVIWHAYDGVDFSYKPFSTLEEAKVFVKENSDNFIKGCDYADVMRTRGTLIVDNSYEWTMWKVIGLT